MIDKVVIVLLVALSVTNALYVPSGFEHVHKNYLVSKTKASFFDAYVACRGHGLNIAHVSSADENSFLASVLQGDRAYFWIGGINYDPIFDGNWFWFDSGAKINFTEWGLAQPNVGSSINGLLFSSGLWYVGNISTDYKFICEV